MVLKTSIGLAAIGTVVALTAPLAPAVASDSESGWRTKPVPGALTAEAARSKTRSKLKLRAPSEVAVGAEVPLRGKLRGTKGKRARVQIQLLAPAGWRTLANVRTKSRGKFRSSVKVAAADNATFRAVAKAQRRKLDATSRSVDVTFIQPAAPATSPSPTSPHPSGQDSFIPDSAVPELEFQMVALVNEARAAGQSCGHLGYFPPAPPLAPNDLLAAAARAHSEDMATNDYVSHTGLDGSQPSDRIFRQGYLWSRGGENIAAGKIFFNASRANQGLLDSPGHCANLMNPGYTEIGVGVASEYDSYWGIYWTQNFGTPRDCSIRLGQLDTCPIPPPSAQTS